MILKFFYIKKMVKVRNNKFNKVINCSFLSLIPGSVVVLYSSHLLLAMQTSTNTLYVNFLDITFFHKYI